jgi:hypothetical protein
MIRGKEGVKLTLDGVEEDVIVFLQWALNTSIW